MEDDIKKQVDDKIGEISSESIQMNNVDLLGKLVDIKKDMANIEYWKKKEEVMDMRYNDYNDYGRRGVPGTGRGRYRGDYGRRGVAGTGRRYRGEDAMEEMQEHYMNYNEASEDMYNGNYGAEGGMVKSVEGIMKNVYKIVEELAEADSPEVMPIIKKYAKKIEELD